jgi:hypothetical protein
VAERPPRTDRPRNRHDSGLRAAKPADAGAGA